MSGKEILSGYGNTSEVIIDNITIESWNLTTNQPSSWGEVTTLGASSNARHFVRNSILNHTHVLYWSDMTKPNTTILEHCSIYEAGISNDGDERVYLHNIVQISSGGGLFSETPYDYSHSYVAYNSFIQQDNWSTNTGIGENSTVIGNEFAGSSWNIVRPYKYSLYRKNILHWNDGKHNAFNGYRESVFLNSFIYDVHGYSGYYHASSDTYAEYGLWEYYPRYFFAFNDIYDYRRNRKKKQVHQ
jgi:hypothetical protein